jgi:TetR/AcrR family transcriptional regulator, tetracycline repressor protein
MSTPSNRKRAPRGTLTRDRIVDAALQLVDAEGLEAVSMPKLAKQLGVGVMSLYTHVDSKDDLLDAVAHHVLASLPAPSGDDWQGRLACHFRDLRATLVQHPGLGTVLATKNVAVPAVFNLLERTLSDVTASGVGDEEAAHLYYDLLVYTLGFVVWELPRTRTMTRREYARRWRYAVDQLDQADHPTLHRLVDALTTVASDAQFEGGLRRIIGSVC